MAQPYIISWDGQDDNDDITNILSEETVASDIIIPVAYVFLLHTLYHLDPELTQTPR